MPPRGSIIMVEDDQALRESIAAYLSRVGFTVVAVDTGLKFYQALAAESFQVALIDIGLPDLNGLQLADYLRNNTAMRCIIMTACDAVDDRVSGYEAGADLYMVKPVECRELASAITRLLQRATAEVRKELPAGQWRLNCQNTTLITPVQCIIHLTAREMDFLRALAIAAGQAVQRSSILLTLGYRDDEFASRALESLVRRLRRKIERAYGSSPILTRHGVGYGFSAPIILS